MALMLLVAVVAANGQTVWAMESYTVANFDELKDAAAKARPGDRLLLSAGFTMDEVVTIPKDVTMEISENTELKGTGKNGIVLEAGASLRCAEDKTLSMSGFATALTIKAGAEVNDGNYILDGNKVGFDLKGKFEGSSRDRLTVSAVSENVKGYRAFTYSDGSEFNRCTVNVEAKNESSEQYSRLILHDAVLTTKGVWYYLDPNGSSKDVLYLDHSEFYAYKATGSSNYKQTGSLHGPSKIINGSKMTMDGSRLTNDKAMLVSDSELVFKNSSAGGLNNNYGGSVLFENSTLTGENMRYNPLYGAGLSGDGGDVVFRGDSVVNTPARDKNADNGGANAPSRYIVTGGSFLIAHTPGYNEHVTVPTNGPENGEEKLTLLTLADSRMETVKPINKNGVPYEYKVARSSADGKKHIWVPTAKVRYKLNNDNASFPDGTKADKTAQTIRGYSLATVEGNADPDIPTDANGVEFLGWHYKDGQGEEQEFNMALPLEADLDVYAKWNSRRIVYHNGNGVDYIYTLNAAETVAPALSYEAADKAKAGFARPGREFRYWTVDPAGQGTRVESGDNLRFEGEETQKDLYAQYNVSYYTVYFSADGGQFSDDSVFKKHPEVFRVMRDANEGEVAELIQKAEYGNRLRDLLGVLSHNELKVDEKAKKTGFLLADTGNWTERVSGKSLKFVDSRFWFITNEGANPQITADTTYYLKWKPDPSVTLFEASATLSGDLWGDAKEQTQAVASVKVGDSISLTGAVETAGIKEQMKSIENIFPNAAADGFDTIQLTGAESGFTAVLTIPEGIELPKTETELNAQATGIGNAFDLESVKLNAGKREITAVFMLKPGMRDYQTLKDAVDSTAGELTIRVENLKISGAGLKNGDTLTVKGTVKGSFSAVAQDKDGTVKRFSFSWNAEQNKDGRDPLAADDKTIQYSMTLLKPYESELPADMLVNGNTEHDEVYEVHHGDELKLTGALNVEPIKTLMNAIQADYPGINEDQIAIHFDEPCVFTAEFRLPQGLKLPGQAEVQVITEDFGSYFEVSETAVSGQKLTVTMKLKQDEIKNYADLKKAVMEAGATNNWMKVSVENILVEDRAASGENLTIVGAVTGSMAATAMKKGTDASGHATVSREKKYAFKWIGTQDAAGKDFAAQEDGTVQLTVRIPKPQQSVLPGDILIGSETEHTRLYTAFQDEAQDYTGAIKIEAIQEQMAAIEALYPNTPHDRIRLDIQEFGFTAVFELPEDMNLAMATVEARDFGSGFVIRDFRKDPSGRKAEITFALSSMPETYDKLEEIVDHAGGSDKWMKLLLKGVRFRDSAERGKPYTVTGTVEGGFRATAISPTGTEKKFNFKWVAEQWKDGQDAIAQPDDRTIRFSSIIPDRFDGELEGDILIGDETEHEKVYPVNAGAVLDYTGAVNVESIKNQMAAIEALYPNTAHDQIILDIKQFLFTADFELPEGMTLPEVLTPIAEDFGPGFVVDRAERLSDRAARISFKLKNAEDIRSYTQLETAVDNAGGTDHWMKLILPGIRLTEKAEKGERYTVVGRVTGDFSSRASVPSGKSELFSFHWISRQWEDGKDAVAEGDDRIRFTVEVRDTTGILNIKKVVVGKDGEEQNNRDEFPVRVWLDALPAGEAGREPLIASQFNTLPWTDAGNYPKQNGENYYRYYTDLSIPANDIISIAGIPDGTGYYVEELTSNTNMPRGYVEDYAGLGTTGSITGNGAVTALIVNYREDAEQSIIIKKSWQKDDEKKRPASVKVKLVPHIGSADGEVVEELVHEYELTKQDGWYKVITGNKLFATMSDASKSDARKQAEALIVGTKSNAASKANAQHLKGLTPSDALVDENGKLLDGDIVNDIVEGIKDFFKKIFGIEDEIVWTVEEIKVPAGYESKVSDPIETKKGLSFEITNTGTKTDTPDKPTPDKPDDPKTPDKPNNSGGSSSGGGSSSSGGHRHNGGSTVPAGPGLNPVPVTPEPTVLAAPDMGRSGSLPKTGERAALLGELLAVLALMAGAWALLGGKRKEQ